MATSEPLVPKGLPYGQRQETKAAMQSAGLPLAPPNRPTGMQLLDRVAGRAEPTAGLRPARDDFDVLREAPPSAFPQPGRTTQPTVDRITLLASSHPDPRVRSVFARMAEYLT